MSISDLPTAFKEEWEILFLSPAIALGYLFHKTGEIRFLWFALFSLTTPAFMFGFSYRARADPLPEFKSESSLAAMVDTSFLLSIIVYFYAHAGAIWFMWEYMEWGDYLMVYLFIGMVFLALVWIFGEASKNIVE